MLEPPAPEILRVVEYEENLWEKRRALDHAVQMIELGTEVKAALDRHRSFLRTVDDLVFDDEGNISTAQTIGPELRRAFINWQQLLANARGEQGRVQHPFVRLLCTIMIMECGIGLDRFQSELQSIAQSCYDQSQEMLNPQRGQK